jgi:ATP-dependent RNA helicase DeaD
MNLPTIKDVNDQRIARFKERIATALQNGEAKAFQPLLEQFETEQNVPAIEIAAALASLMQGSTPFLLENRPEPQQFHDSSGERGRRDFVPRERSERFTRDERPARSARPDRGPREAAPPLETFRIEVGNVHGALPGNIVGAIANEAGVDGRHIGHIDIREDHSFVDLPVGMPDDIFQELQSVQIRGNPLRISRAIKPPRVDRVERAGKPGGFKPREFKPGGFGAARKARPGGPPKSHRKTPKG